MVPPRRPGLSSQPLVGHAHHWGERLFALGLLIGLIALVPLAYASPPDPLWIAGIYDAADFDEVALAVISATAVLEHTRLLLAKLTDVSAGTVGLVDAGVVSAVVLSASHPRAPPF